MKEAEIRVGQEASSRLRNIDQSLDRFVVHFAVKFLVSISNERLACFSLLTQTLYFERFPGLRERKNENFQLLHEIQLAVDFKSLKFIKKS